MPDKHQRVRYLTGGLGHRCRGAFASTFDSNCAGGTRLGHGEPRHDRRHAGKCLRLSLRLWRWFFLGLWHCFFLGLWRWFFLGLRRWFFLVLWVRFWFNFRCGLGVLRGLCLFLHWSGLDSHHGKPRDHRREGVVCRWGRSYCALGLRGRAGHRKGIAPGVRHVPCRHGRQRTEGPSFRRGQPGHNRREDVIRWSRSLLRSCGLRRLQVSLLCGVRPPNSWPRRGVPSDDRGRMDKTTSR